MAMVQRHELKTWVQPFQALRKGEKKFEFRQNDRGFKVGDELLLREWDHKKKRYTGFEIIATVSYILEGGFGLPEGFCIMQLRNIALATF